MIKIEAITISEIRGIRELHLELDEKPFVISGPNGSGKSGVVDAIEFCLTGDISRLAGKGTAGITLQRHGPHVDRRDDPEVAEVALRLHLVELDRTVVVTRNMKKPKELRIDPDEPAIRTAVADLANHPELVLSRREIIKYVLAEAGERSKEVQVLLRLDGIGHIRSVLGTATNRLKATSAQTTGDAATALESLKRHLDIETTSSESIMSAVNARREILGLEKFTTLTEHTVLDSGVVASASSSTFNKQSAVRDAEALVEALKGISDVARDEVNKLLEELSAVEADPGLLELVQRESFIERGLELVDSEFCPLCDTEWSDIGALKSHIEGKLARSTTAGALRKSILGNAAAVASGVRTIQALIGPVVVTTKAESNDALTKVLTDWSDDMGELGKQMATVDAALRSKERLAKGWSDTPTNLGSLLDAHVSGLKAKPDQSATVNAQTFLTRAQDRYSDYRRARQKDTAAGEAYGAARKAYETYCAVAETSLSSMYESVEKDFSDFYRDINADDESGFKARFEQGEGKLDLSVDFYGIGMFPPGAYHSEGHQDGMGVCLYLALMKRLFGDQFSFAVLDDVVMSIDQGHRKQFCRLLRERFPDTQFVITTHDSIWARQMRSAGLIDAKSSVEFQGWSVQTGPVFEPVSEVWDRIDADLAKNDVPAAAGRLRRHLEYTSTELADLIAAPIPFRGDASYDLGDLFSAVMGRQRDLLGVAAGAANSWNDASAKLKVEDLKERRRLALATYGDEQWVVNKAIHYNEWADLSRADFQPVVKAVRALLEAWQCSKCASWFSPSSKDNPKTLGCRCGAFVVNLEKK